MEVFIEYLVQKHSDSKTTLTKAGIIVAAIVLCLILFIACVNIEFIRFLYVFFVAGIVYGAWYLITSLRLEFEYILTNNEMDVDKIIAQRRRKRLVTVDFKNIEIMAPKTDKYKRDFDPNGIKTVVHAETGDPKDEYFVKFSSEKTGMTLLFFNPDDRIISGARHASPRKVFQE